VTDEEELELLRLRKRKALAAQTAKAGPAEPAAQPAAEPPGLGESALRGAGQGFTFGQGANAGGLIQALLEKGVQGGGKGSFAETYARNKGTFQRENDAAWEAHPWAYGLGNAGATIASLFAPFGAKAKAAGATADAAQLAGRGGQTLAKLAYQGAKSGLKFGGAMGAGNGLEDLLGGNYSRFAGDVALGAIPGMAMGGALAPVPGLVARAAPALQNFAARQAVKAAGLLPRDVAALLSSGRLGSVGKKLLDMGLVPSGSTIEQIAGKAGNAAEQRGADVHGVLGELDALQAPAVAASTAARASGLSRPMLPENVPVTANGLTQLPPALEGRRVGDFPGSADLMPSADTFIPGGDTVNRRVPGLAELAASAPKELPGFNPMQVAKRAREELLNPLRDQPAQKHLAPGLEEQIQNLEDLGNRRLTFQRANDITRGYDKILDSTEKQTPAKDLLEQLRGLVNEEIEKHADAAASQAGDSDLYGRLMSAKHDYRDLREVSDFANKAVAGQEAQPYLSLPDTIIGVAPALGALAAGHPLAALGGLASAFGHKLLRERGNSVAANVAQNLGERLSVPNNLGSLLSQRAASWQARSQGQRTLYDLLGGANLLPAPQGAPVSLGASP
jgi:hypothetical protein